MSQVYLDLTNKQNFSFMFSNLTNIVSVDMYFNIGLNSSMSYMFCNCINLVHFNYNNNYEESHIIKDMKGMLYNCTSLTSFSFNNFYLNVYIEIIEHGYGLFSYSEEIEVCNLFNLSYMFYNCKNLKTIDIFGDTNNKVIKDIIDMRKMFYNCISLTSINLEHFIASSNIDLSFMFYNCQNLKSVIFPNSNGFKVNNMKNMFYNCQSLISIDLQKFKRTNSNLNFSYLFYNCTNLIKVEDNFNNFLVSDTIEMFYKCISLTSLIFHPYTISSRINMTKMFYNCSIIKSISFKINYNNVNPPTQYFEQNDMSKMFYNCNSLISLTLSHFKTDKTQYISYMLYNCKKLEEFSLYQSDFTNLLITDIRGTFQNCESIVTLDLSNFYTPKVEIM